MVDFFMNYKSQISVFFIAYFPTIMFFLVILLTMLVSFLRGIRKTRISIVHSLIAFTICLILFIALVEDKNVDAFLLNVTNSIVGKGGMQRIFGVSEDCLTFREIFIEFIPKQLNFMDGIALIAKDNGKYLSSLVDVSYRLVFGIVLYFVYWIFRFILWIIYLIFYNERKYVRKREKKYENGLIDSPYRKKRLLSTFVGFGKGLVSALIMISFVGMFFYIFAGGLGDKKTTEKIQTHNETVNFAFDAYSELETYGTKGIFKVLNAVRDEKNMPYYLFAANMIFQGKIEDGKETTNVYLIDELATYVNFSKNTFNLFLKYDKENIVKLVNQEENINIMDEIVKVFKNENFQREFEELITQFETKTYFVNLTLSLIDSLSNHLTDVQFTQGLSQDILTPLRIMFEEGYLCEDIPYERELLVKKTTTRGSSSYNENDYILDCIKPSELLTRDDVFNIYKVFVSFLTNVYQSDNTVDSILNALKESLPNIKNLSILSGSRAGELDGVFRRIYSYLENKYLGGDSEIVQLTSSSYEDKRYTSISWVEELSMLVDVLDSGLTLYDENFKEFDNSELLDKILTLFEDKNKDKLNKVLNAVSSSRIIGELFGTKFFVENYESITQNLLSSISFPEGISFGNIYDNEGHFKDFGEFYYVIRGLNALMSNADTKDLIADLTNPENSDVDPFQLLSRISGILSSRYGAQTIGDAVVDSRIIDSILSAYLIENKNISDGVTIYIDDSILEKNSNGETINIIQKEELRELFSNFPTFVEVAEPMMNNEGIKQEELLELVKDQRVIKMLDSKIIEGTISYLAANNITGTIIIPQSMKDGVDLITTGNHTSEVRKLIEVLNEVDINLEALTGESLDEDTRKSLINLFKSLDEKSLDLVLSSNILYYTISNFLNENGDKVVGALQLIVPDIANEPLVNDTIDKVIKKEILREFIYDIRAIIPEDEVLTIDLLSLIIQNKYVMDNLIISVTTANLIANELQQLSTLKDVLDIPTKYNNENYGNKTKLKEEFSTTNPWYLEAKALINALNLIMVFDDEGKIDYEYLADDIISQIPTLNDTIQGTNETKLDKLYDSEIFVRTLSANIDSKLSGTSMIDQDILDKAKVYGTGNYRKSDIRALVNALKLYDIDIDSSDIGDIIYEDVKSNLTHYLDKMSEYNNKSKLDLLYESSIIKALFTNNIKQVLIDNKIVEESSLTLCYDSNDYLRQGEIESLIYLLKTLDIDDIDNVNPEMMMNDINNITTDDIDVLYKYNLTALLLYKVLNDSNKVYIANEARIQKNGKIYDAINKEEAMALVYALTTLDVSLDDMSIGDVNFDTVDIDIISKSTIISSIFYKSIKNISDIVVPAVVKISAKDDTDKAYITINEFKEFLTIIKENKNTFFGDGEIALERLSDIEPSDISPELIIRMCSSRILSTTLAYKISSYLPGRTITQINDSPENIMEQYKYAGQRDELEKKDNIWIERNEMRNLAYALDALGVTYDDIENETDLSERINPFDLNQQYNSTNTKFDICYKSEIIQYLISDSIYKSIDDSLLEEGIKNYSYIYNDEKKTYNKDEIKNLLDALDILEIRSLDDLSTDGIDIDTFKEKSQDDRLYDSYIIKGILTKKIHEEIYNSANELYDCKACYEEFVDVYRKEELLSLFSLIADKDIDNLDVEEDINLLEMLDLIYSNEETKSYIIVATASKNIIKSGVTIPQDDFDTNVLVYDKFAGNTYGIINPQALREFIEAVSSFGIQIRGVNVVIDDTINVPTDATDEDLATIARSNILRANISSRLKINDNDVLVEFDSQYVDVTKSAISNNRIAIISDTELIVIINIINLISTDKAIGSIDLSPTTLMNKISNPSSDEAQLLLSSSAIRVILGAQPMLSLFSVPKLTINLTDASESNNSVYVGSTQI